MKKNKLKTPFFVTIFAMAALLLLALAITAQCVCAYYDGVVRDFLGVIGETRVREAHDGLNKNYYLSDYESIDKLNEYERRLVREIGGEGYVLLKNAGGGKGLPIATEKNDKTKLSLFSHSSVDLIAGGTGSGTGSSDVDLKTALEACDYKVNGVLWNFYLTGNGSSYKRGPGSVNYGHGKEDWRINECPLSVMKKEKGLLQSAVGTKAIFVLARTGGEGRDLARGMQEHTGLTEDKNKHYLEPDSVELEIISYLNENFDDVILLVNTNNAPELGWVENYSSITAVLWVPGGGGETASSVADIVCGKVNPSGRLVDTLAYDAFSSPAMANFGDIRYCIGGAPATVDGKPLTDENNSSSRNNGYYGVSYDEGIYVGYKYYETRYYDKVCNVGNAGDYDYSSVVQYPFGFGLSYTEFLWSDFSFSLLNDGNFLIEATIKNVGSVPGKEVVQAYVSAPYTEFDKVNKIEKAAVSLVGYAKTKLLSSGESERVKIEIDKEELLSYDDVVEKSYFLEKGRYYFTLADSAHSAADNVLKAEGKNVEGDENFVAYRDVPATEIVRTNAAGKEVTNVFDDANYIDRKSYLSRADWVGTFPVTHGKKSKNKSLYSERGGYTLEEEISQKLYDDLRKKGTAEAALSPVKDADVASKAREFSSGGGLELIDYRGKNFKEADWGALVGQMSKEEVGTIINLSGYATAQAASIVKPKAVDLDGPMGLNLMATHEPFSVAYPAEVTIAATWNKALSAAHGNAVANDGLRNNVLASGWYGPGLNIHRTPFSGRNFEYYSEDAFLCADMAEAAVRAAAEKGMYSFVKHFALNDQEDHRDQNGLATWANEQTIREIYLKPFRKVFESGTVKTRYFNHADSDKEEFADTPVALAVMTSFNRIGATWAGGDYRLITKILREEWCFNGIVLTDYSNGAESYMHTEQMLRAGGDAQLSQYGTTFSSLDGANAYYAQQAMAHVLYTVVNSNAMNGFSHGAKIGSKGVPTYYFIVAAIYVCSAAIAATGTVLTVRRIKKDKTAR